MGHSVEVVETYLRLALKAQSQCRATLETLAVIKNPQPVAFVHQANIAHGPQQVNNAAASLGEPSRARETENQQNKLLEAKNGERLDLKTAAATGEVNSSLEAVGPLDGPKTPTGKARVSRNADKGGTRPLLRKLARLLRQQERERSKIGS
jgi:hypothetical protein